MLDVTLGRTPATFDHVHRALVFSGPRESRLPYAAQEVRIEDILEVVEVIEPLPILEDAVVAAEPPPARHARGLTLALAVAIIFAAPLLVVVVAEAGGTAPIPTSREIPHAAVDSAAAAKPRLPATAVAAAVVDSVPVVRVEDLPRAPNPWHHGRAR